MRDAQINEVMDEGGPHYEVWLLNDDQEVVRCIEAASIEEATDIKDAWLERGEVE